MENGTRDRLAGDTGEVELMGERSEFGQWLVETLSERGLNQSVLARRIGAAVPTVNRWVNEARIPQPKFVEPLARELGVSTDEVLIAAGMIPEGRARLGPRARLSDLVGWLPDQEVEAVLAFAEFRAERARASIRSRSNRNRSWAEDEASSDTPSHDDDPSK